MPSPWRDERLRSGNRDFRFQYLAVVAQAISLEYRDVAVLCDAATAQQARLDMGCIDNEFVLFPMAHGVSGARRRQIVRRRPAIYSNSAHHAENLIEKHHQFLGLHNLERVDNQARTRKPGWHAANDRIGQRIERVEVRPRPRR